MAFKRFLVPVDYSEQSRAALKQAAELARDVQGEIVVLNVVPAAIPTTPVYVAPMAGFGPLHKDIVDNARTYLDALQPLTQGLPVRSMVRSGDTVETIVATALEEQADAIVMTAHGKHGLSGLFKSGTAEAVLHQAKVPVILLPVSSLVPDEATASIKAPPIL